MYLNLGFSILNNFSSKKSLKTSRAGTCCQDRTHRAVSGCRPRCLGLGSQAQVLSLVLGFSEPEVSPVAGGESNATWKTASPKQGTPGYLC